MNYFQEQMADAIVENIINTSDEDILQEVKEDYGDENFLANKMRGIIKEAKETVKNENYRQCPNCGGHAVKEGHNNHCPHCDFWW